MPNTGTGQGLGVLNPDSARTILVITSDGDLAVALREKVDRIYALVKDVRPHEASDGIATCMPWPWMVVGGVDELPADALDVLRTRPILTFWRGPVPPGLPAHARTFERFADLAAAVNDSLRHTVEGMRLAIGLGVDMPNGTYARSAELQALVAGHPHAFEMPLDAFRSAARVLHQHHVPLRPGHPAQGMVGLVEAREEANATS